MSTLIVEKGQATCPNCNEHLNVISKVNGKGSKPQGDTHLRKITKGIKLEIICAYLNDPGILWTTRQIIEIINLHRNEDNKIERSALTRPHSELIDSGIIITDHRDGYDWYYRIDVKKASQYLQA